MVMCKTSQGESFLASEAILVEIYKSYISQSMNEKKRNNYQDVD